VAFAGNAVWLAFDEEEINDGFFAKQIPDFLAIDIRRLAKI